MATRTMQKRVLDRLESDLAIGKIELIVDYTVASNVGVLSVLRGDEIVGRRRVRFDFQGEYATFKREGGQRVVASMRYDEPEAAEQGYIALFEYLVDVEPAF